MPQSNRTKNHAGAGMREEPCWGDVHHVIVFSPGPTAHPNHGCGRGATSLPNEPISTKEGSVVLSSCNKWGKWHYCSFHKWRRVCHGNERTETQHSPTVRTYEPTDISGSVRTPCGRHASRSCASSEPGRAIDAAHNEVWRAPMERAYPVYTQTGPSATRGPFLHIQPTVMARTW